MEVGQRSTSAVERGLLNRPRAPGSTPAQPATAPVDARLVWTVVLGATVLAAALRLPFLGHQSLWLDEAYTRSIVGEPSLVGLWNHVTATESTPPLYYLVVWLLGGRSAAALRVVPACALIAAVPVSYLAFRRIIGEWPAAATALVLAVSPELVAYSLDGRAYGLFVLAALFSVWAFGALLSNPAKRGYLAWAIASVACVWTHYFGVFLVAGEVVALLVLVPGARKRTGAFAVLIVAGVAPLIPLVTQQNSDERAGFIASSSLGGRVVNTAREFAMGTNVPRTWLEAAGLAIAAAAFVAGVLIAVRSRSPARSLVALAAFGLLVPLAIAVIGLEDRFYDRNLLFVLPLAAAIAAPVLVRARAAPLLAYCALAILTSVWVATNWRYENPDWRGALARASALDRTAAVIAVTPAGRPVVQTYLGRGPAATPTTADAAWIIVEPARAAHHRALGRAPVPPGLAQGLPGFAARQTVTLHGFRLILLNATKPRSIDPAEPGGAAVFAPPA